ncbi:MAG TPA: T9SS type A sorting domain-containing protein [Ignavibacteria bacterium]|nr:hypothetical protein [Bacteroidota bacterium]HRI85144.1 T9SS type A sorting domain-containing protein [Ignavibacteria bacterium]HRK00879.1 T9SS type A sorting domain-containing protein [Ignavibacteria bacterium]
MFTGDFYRVSFINDNTGYTASHRAVYKTTNFGTNWDSVGNIPVSLGSVLSVEFCNENTGWAGTQYQMYKTTNGGRNWLIQNSTLPGVVYSLWAFNDSLVWGCGNGGRIWHTIRGGDTLTNINNVSTSVIKEFRLFQNYPNPFNNKTIIKLEIIKMGNYEIEIFNIAGKKIETIFNGELNTGQYEIIFNAKELSSGIYFYRLSGNNISETKKLLLIK